MAKVLEKKLTSRFPVVRNPNNAGAELQIQRWKSQRNKNHRLPYRFLIDFSLLVLA
jgi:hypothetical protein